MPRGAGGESLVLDKLTIKGVEAKGTHGVNADEKIYPQTFKVDLTVWFDLSEAARSDDLNDTVNYSKLQKIAVHTIKQTHFNLIETLGSTMLDEILKSDGRIKKARIALHKPEAPLGLPFKDVVIKMQRLQKSND